MTDSNTSIARIVSMVAASVIICLVCVSLALARRDANTYPSNVWAGGISIGNMTHEQAVKTLTDQSKAVWRTNLIFTLPDKKLTIPLIDLGAHYDYEATLDKADKMLFAGEGGDTLFRHSVIRGARQEISPVLRWDAAVLKKRILKIKQENDKPAVGARILYSNNYLEYISHRNGYSIDAEESYKRAAESLDNGNLESVSLVIHELYPRVKLDDIKEVKDILGVCITYLPGGSEKYKNALESINGLIIMPSDRIPLDAIKGTVVDDALKKACSQAGFKFEGADITNAMAHPILITCLTEGNSLMIRIFGCQTEPAKKIEVVEEKRELKPEVQVKINRKWSPTDRVVQQEGVSGYVERKYRVVKVNGRAVEKTLLSEEIYPPSDTIIMVGPGASKD